MNEGWRLAALALCLVTLFGAACTSGISLPTAITEINGTAILCAGGSYAERATLHGSAADPALTWITFHRSGGRRNVLWPAGYRARFTPQLEVIDPAGSVVAREGQAVRGGCPMHPDGEMIEL